MITWVRKVLEASRMKSSPDRRKYDREVMVV